MAPNFTLSVYLYNSYSNIYLNTYTLTHKYLPRGKFGSFADSNRVDTFVECNLHFGEYSAKYNI